ncbi:histone-lysine N-methyltransferase trithorax isoform X2 [Hetaerina americana]|uniref:histone-lysine N-methyltransferase trithorax isoform X2 n=1 Tax=Hetaerina americana TaxID=62018 RepID=UPI003A7F1509
MAKPRFPGKPHRLLSRYRTRISTASAQHDDDTVDVVGNICLGLAIFKQNFGDYEEPYIPGTNEFKGFNRREVAECKLRAKRKLKEIERCDISTRTCPTAPLHLVSSNNPETSRTVTIKDEKKDDSGEANSEVVGIPASKRARRKGGGRRSLSLVPKQGVSPANAPMIKDETPLKEEPLVEPLPSVSMLPEVEVPSSIVGHPLIVEGKRRWKPTYKVLQGPSSLEESRRLGGEAWPFGARPINRAVEAPAPIGGKFVTGSAEKDQDGKSSWKLGSSSSGVRPSGGGILREARLHLDSAASGSEDGEWVRRMMDETEKSKRPLVEPKTIPQSPVLEGSAEKSASESESSPARVYCRICKGAMSRRFSKRKIGKRGVWSCKACREFVTEMNKKLRSDKGVEDSQAKESTSANILVCRGGKGKCIEEEGWPQAPPQRCVPCWLRLCLNAPPPHLIPCPVSRAALRKLIPQHASQLAKEPMKRGKKRRARKELQNKGKRQKVTAEGPRVKHVCRSAMAVLGRPPATFPAREPLKAHGGEAATVQETETSAEIKAAEGNVEKQPDTNDEKTDAGDSATPPSMATVGAHQWWKQRKGIRRRKRGRLSLAMPRRDGKPALHHTVPKLHAVAKTGATPAPRPSEPAVVLGPPIQLAGFPFRPNAAEVFTNGFGVVQVAPNTMPVQPLCFLCGSGGKKWLVHCALCCEPFHTFCVEWAGWDVFDGWDLQIKGPPKLHDGEKFPPLDWLCRRCSLCHACGLPAYVPGGGMPSATSKGNRNKEISTNEKKEKAEEESDTKKKKKDADSANGKADDDENEVVEDMGTRTCNICHRCYHGVCLGPNGSKVGELASFKDKDKPWVCSTCLRCHSCGKSSVAGSVPRNSHAEDKEAGQVDLEQTGPEEILMCAQCLALHRKRNFCPLCHVVYRDTDFDASMMQCAQCTYWVHASCEGLSDDQYHLLSLLPSSVEFTCSPCTKDACPAWKKAMDKKLRQGFEKILEVIDAAANSKNATALSYSQSLSDMSNPPLNPSNISESSNSVSQSQPEKQSEICTQAEQQDLGASNKDNSLNQQPSPKAKCSSSVLNRAACDSDNGDKNESKGNLNSLKRKSSCDTGKYAAQISDKPRDMLLLRERVNRGDFVALNDFYMAVEKLFYDNEGVLSTLNSALVKVFPWVKPKTCTIDVKKKLDVIINDHCYTSVGKNSEIIQWIPKALSEEKDNLITLDISDNISLKPTLPSCDLQSSDEVLGSQFESCSESNVNKKCSQSKEQSNQNENLWMDPSDYVPNHKVYSFASALRRRSINRKSLSLSTFSQPKSKPSNSPEHDNSVMLEHSRNIVTYKSVLAGIKKEAIDSERDDDAGDMMDDCEIKLEDTADSDVNSTKEPDTCLEDSHNSNHEDENPCLSTSEENNNKSPIPTGNTLVPNASNRLMDSSEIQKETSTAAECNSSIVGKSPTSSECIESHPRTDGRRCLFCHVKGDADVDREGRLLLASAYGDWVHCNCALWSAEVFEEKGGLLMKVREAVNRGRRVRCALCQNSGATLGCCLRGCPDSYHLGCALRSGCLLQEDKSVYCRNHIPIDQKDPSVELPLKRPVHIDTEGRQGSVLWRWRKPGRGKRKPGEDGTTFPAGGLRFTVGSLHVESLGKIIPGSIQGQLLRPPEGKCKVSSEEEMRWCEGGVSLAKKDEEEAKVSEMLISGGAPVIVPVGLSCTRLYWSSVEPWKVVEYHIQTMLVISEVEEINSSANEEKEEAFNEKEEQEAHVTVDHSAEAESLNHVKDDEEQPDLIVPLDISDEIIKDIPPDIFANKKLMQSILVGLLKGVSNGESQNGVSHLFEADDEGNILKGHKDGECPASSLPSNQAIKVPRHSKPVNVVQPVSKEALLSTESASSAWELTCEMRPAQTPPPSASPIMTGAAGNAPESSTTMIPANKTAIWSEDSKKAWKHVRPIPQLDGNADPSSSSSSEGGGNSPLRTSPTREPSQPIPCLLACRIKQQSLAHSEPGGGGPVKCNKCRRTYRTREGYERHLCETPFPLSSTSSDSDSEDRTSRRVSSESDIATPGEDTLPNSVETDDCFNDYPEKEKFAGDGIVEDKEQILHNKYTANSVPGGDEKDISIPETLGASVAPEIAEQTNTSNMNVCSSLPSITNKSHVDNTIIDSNVCQEFPNAEHCNNVSNSIASKESKELSHQMDDPQVVCTNNTEGKQMISSSDSLNVNCNSHFYSENLSHPVDRVAANPSNQTVALKEIKEGVWRGLTTDSYPSRSTKRQTAMVQPLCYVNGKRRVPSGDSSDINKVSRFSVPQDDSFLCPTQQQVSQGSVTQPPLVSAPLPPSVNNNFQVLVRQLSSASAVPQFAENFRQQTGHTLQYLATIDSGSFTQQAGIPQAQGLVGLIQSSAQLVQTQALVSPPQVMAPSPIVLAPQQPTLVYNPVTACLEALPAQQQSFILTPPAPAYTIPVSSSLQYNIGEDMQQVYFQSAPMSHSPHPQPPPAPMPTPAPPPPALEPIIHTDAGWSLPPGYQIVQNPPMEQPQALLMPTPPVASTPVPQANVPMQPPPVDTCPEETPQLTLPKAVIPNTQWPAKRKRLILPNLQPTPREGVKAYRRDEKTGKYVPLDEGWVDLVDSNQKNQVMSEEFCARTGLLPSACTPDVKDPSRKDIMGGIRRKSICRKSDGETSSGLVNEAVVKQDNSATCVKVKPPTDSWRLPSKDSFVHKQTMDKGVNCSRSRGGSANGVLDKVTHGVGKTVKRVESTSVMYQVQSADGIKIESDTPDKIWDQVFNSVQKARVAHGLAPLPRNPFAPMSGCKPFMGAETLALSHKGLRYLLNQLPGASQLLKSESGVKEPTSNNLPPHRLFSRAHLSLSTQTPVPETPVVPPPPCSPPLPENPSGCARSEPFKCPPPPPNPTVPGEPCPSLKNRKWQHRDIFGWLASPHRKLPLAPLPTQENEANGGGNRGRATSLDLPMAMRFRHLKETSREAVGVYRSHIHGRGLFCLKDIEAGEMVIEYSGEVIRSSLTDTREKTYEAKGMGCYMFRIDEQTVVDATMRGNAARFINHSCEPNCYSRVVDILGKKHILIFALRRIPRGEELTYDYKFPFEDVKIPCHCASKRCRKYLN